MVQWGPEICILDEAHEQYTMGFNIVSITNLDDGVPTEDLQPFVSVKRLTTQQRRKYKQPPPATRCLLQFAPSPKRRHTSNPSKGDRRLSRRSFQRNPNPHRARHGRQPIRHELLPLNGARRRKRRLAQSNGRSAQHLPLQEGSSHQRLPQRHQHDPPDAHTLTSSTSWWRRETRTRLPT